jgi:hypothetical protein
MHHMIDMRHGKMRVTVGTGWRTANDSMSVGAASSEVRCIADRGEDFSIGDRS